MLCVAPIDSARWRAGVDDPADLSEFDRLFPDGEACTRCLERLGWPDGFACPNRRGAAEARRMSRGLLLCGQAGRTGTCVIPPLWIVRAG